MALCKVAVTDGVPALFVDGERVPPVLYGLSDIPASRADTAQAQRNIRQFSGAGVRLVCADAELRRCWHKQTTFDPDPVREVIASVLDAVPQAKVLVRLHLNPRVLVAAGSPAGVCRLPHTGGRCAGHR